MSTYQGRPGVLQMVLREINFNRTIKQSVDVHGTGVWGACVRAGMKCVRACVCAYVCAMDQYIWRSPYKVHPRWIPVPQPYPQPTPGINAIASRIQQFWRELFLPDAVAHGRAKRTIIVRTVCSRCPWMAGGGEGSIICIIGRASLLIGSRACC